MMEQPPRQPGQPFILASSCVLPSGPCVALADKAMTVQLALFNRHPQYADRCGQPIAASFFPDDSVPFDEGRWFILARNALDQLLASLEKQQHADATHGIDWPPRWQLRIVLPTGCGEEFGREFFMALPKAVTLADWPWEVIGAQDGGHAKGIGAVCRAMASIEKDPDLNIVILAVDSPLDLDSLRRLESRQRLHGAHQFYEHGLRANPYGRIPGEGAAAIALGGGHRHRGHWATLLACAGAQETHTDGSATPCTGQGLGQAASNAFEQAPGEVAHVCTDFNGEPYRADELGFTLKRISRRLSPGWQRTAPALISGDIGCASAIAHIALAAYRLSQEPDMGRHLILSSSDDGDRGAAILGARQATPLMKG